MPDVIRHPEGGGAGIQSDERVRQTSTKAMEMSDYARGCHQLRRITEAAR